MKNTETKDLNYYKQNCEEDYINTPISVLRYISELEEAINYTHSCTQLKDKKRPTFEFWCDVNGIVNVNDFYIYKGDQVSVEYLVGKYVKETDNL